MKRSQIKKIVHHEKIAAGEVVERPANVIKELIENSIDASGNTIQINIKKAGKLSIQVIDDGIGIPSDELELAFERHTSSKIRSIKDLDKLHTLGFRGEALASIAAISKVIIISRAKEEALGKQLSIEGGTILKKKEVSAPVGTNITIKNLFYNIPARKKFLKSDATELGHISDIIQRYSLCYPHIHFIYRHNELTLLNCPSDNDLRTTAFHIYGKKIAKNMELISYEEKPYLFKVEGLLGHPKIAKKGRSRSSLFLNNRYIKSKLIRDAIHEAYGGILMVNRTPFFIIHIEVDPSVIDFNVHPKKLKVRFEDEDFIYNKIYNVVRHFLDEKFVKGEPKYLETELDEYTKSNIEATESSKDAANLNPISRQEIRQRLEDNENNEKEFGDTTASLKSISLNELSPQEINSVQLNLDDNITKDRDSKGSDTYLRRKFIINKNFPKIRLISFTGQLSNNIYIVLEGINEDNEKGLFILDQHAASERINKEFLYKAYDSSNRIKQKLISPLKIEVSLSEKSFLESNLDILRDLGFNFEPFGGNTYILREIPTIFNKAVNIEVVKDIVSDITEIGRDKSFSEVEEKIINYLACHRSIRGGDELSLKDIRRLIKELAECEDPFHCAHGRPTLKFFSFKELDKLFKRTG
jgi:DNA mismatch repair protein MutL